MNSSSWTPLPELPTALEQPMVPVINQNTHTYEGKQQVHYFNYQHVTTPETSNTAGLETVLAAMASTKPIQAPGGDTNTQLIPCQNQNLPNTRISVTPQYNSSSSVVTTALTEVPTCRNVNPWLLNYLDWNYPEAFKRIEPKTVVQLVEICKKSQQCSRRESANLKIREQFEVIMLWVRFCFFQFHPCSHSLIPIITHTQNLLYYTNPEIGFKAQKQNVDNALSSLQVKLFQAWYSRRQIERETERKREK